MLSGKSKPTNEKNLQELFTEFYGKAKTSVKSPSEMVNSAKSSLGGLGSKLEERRQKLKNLKSKTMDGDMNNKGQSRTETTQKEPTGEQAT